MSPTPARAFPAGRESPPRGFYRAAEVGKLAGVPGAVVGRWKRRCYIRASRSADKSPKDKSPKDKSPNVYAYQDAAEAMVVHDLVDRGVPPRHIRQVMARLREENGKDWPLQAERLLVPGEPESKGSVRVDRPGEPLVLAAMTSSHSVPALANAPVLDPEGLPVLSPEYLRLIAQQLHNGGWAVRELPGLRHIEVDPDKMSGRPSIKRLRIAAEDVAVIAEESGHEVVKAEYELEDSEIRDAVAWWGAVQRFGEAA